MHQVMRFFALAGLALLGWLLWQHGDEPLHALLSVGFGIVPVIFFHVLQLWCSGAAWHAVADTAVPIPLRTYVTTRWIREAVGGLLPVAQLGGEVIGARLLVVSGARTPEAAASTTVDLTVEALTLVVFILIGLGFALLTGTGQGLVAGTLLALAAFVPAVIALLLVQRRGLAVLLDKLARWLERRWPARNFSGLRELHAAFEACYRNPRGLAAGCVWHLAGWLGGVIEIYVMGLVLGMPISVGQALVIESLGQAIRGAAFFVPAGIGVQEASLVWLATELGLSPTTGLALALLKRVRELALGLPALLAWHAIESGRWSRFRRPASKLSES